MEKQQLLKKLASLRAELANTETESLDKESQAMLNRLNDDIERLLSRAGEGDAEEDEEQLSDQVQDLVLKFETEHPRLTSALNQVAAALSNLGI